jgi:hypothetical protein
VLTARARNARDIKARATARSWTTATRIREHAAGVFKNWTRRAIESAADGLVAAIFARSTDTFTSAVRSVRLGYGAQAAMLNRSLFGDMVDRLA